MGLRLITPPAAEPLTVWDLEHHLKVDLSYVSEQEYVSGLIKAARGYAEGVLQRALVTQTWEMVGDALPTDGKISIPRPPLQSVESITLIDSEGAEHTVDPASYVVETTETPGRVVRVAGRPWPSVTLRAAGAVRVRFVAGYGGPEAVPERIKQAMTLLIGHWYENREAVVIGTVVTEIPMTVRALLAFDRFYGG